jgi:hypothetical protein
LRSIISFGFSLAEVPSEVWPLFFVRVATGFFPASRLACSDSSSISSQSALD